MRVLLLLISFVLFLSANAQKVEFGLNIQGGLSTLSTKHSSIQSFNSNQGIPSESDWVHATRWSTKQIDLKLYLSRPKNLSISLGVRAFRFKWEHLFKI
ncbi:MAG: outer membrane lipoprotein-sorting protein [Crocinitomicaceae bacterium]|jgi:outer membrane lipoprotein-sorting protein